MSAISNIDRLLKAVQAMFELPAMQIKENAGLRQEIKNVLSSGMITGILHDIKNEYQQEKAAAYNSKQDKGFNFDKPEFLHLYAKYQGAGFGVLQDMQRSVRGLIKPKVAFTNLVNKKGLIAYNSKNGNPFAASRIKTLPETRIFKEAFEEAKNSLYSDKSVQINTAQDPTMVSSYIDYSPYIWNMRHYLGIPTLSQTIQHPNNLACRNMPIIECENKELSELLEKHFRKTQFQQMNVKKMLHYSDLSPRGALLVPIEENGKIRFNCFNDTQFTYATSYQYSRIDFHDTHAGVSQLYCLGHILQNEETGHFLCPDFEPLFAIGKNQVYRLKDTAEAINIFLYTIKVLCIRAQTIVTKGGESGETDTKIGAMMKTLKQINSRLSLSEAVQLPEDQEMTILPSNFTPGFSDVPTIIKEVQGMLSEMHGDFYYGSSNAYQANSFNLNITHQNINSQIQEPKITPIYRFAINTLLSRDVRFKEYRNEVDNFEIKHKSLYEMNETEKAELAAKKIDNLIKMAEYPELADQFKKEELLPQEFNLPTIEHDEET